MHLLKPRQLCPCLRGNSTFGQIIHLQGSQFTGDGSAGGEASPPSGLGAGPREALSKARSCALGGPPGRRGYPCANVCVHTPHAEGARRSPAGPVRGKRGAAVAGRPHTGAAFTALARFHSGQTLREHTCTHASTCARDTGTHLRTGANVSVVHPLSLLCASR